MEGSPREDQWQNSDRTQPPSSAFQPCSPNVGEGVTSDLRIASVLGAALCFVKPQLKARSFLCDPKRGHKQARPCSRGLMPGSVV